MLSHASTGPLKTSQGHILEKDRHHKARGKSLSLAIQAMLFKHSRIDFFSEKGRNARENREGKRCIVKPFNSQHCETGREIFLWSNNLIQTSALVVNSAMLQNKIPWGAICQFFWGIRLWTHYMYRTTDVSTWNMKEQHSIVNVVAL